MAKEEKATKEEVQEKIQKEENSADETLNEDQKDENVVSLEEKVQASEDKFLRIFS